MAQLQLVIFDCDGVVVDSERISHAVLVEMLAELGVRLSLEEAFDRFIGASEPKTLKIIASLIGHEPPSDMAAQFAERSQAAFLKTLTAVPGVEEVLSALVQPYCVASNGSRKKVNFTLGHTGLIDRFPDRIFSAEEVANPKPAPDLFLHAAHSLGAVPARCLVIEDTPRGIMAARAAGMFAVGFCAMTPAYRLREAGAHEVFASMAELPNLLRQFERNG